MDVYMYTITRAHTFLHKHTLGCINNKKVVQLLLLCYYELYCYILEASETADIGSEQFCMNYGFNLIMNGNVTKDILAGLHTEEL